MKHKAMLDKHEHLSNFGMSTKMDIAKTMAIYSGFTEGVQLFSSFAILLNFPRHNLMKGMGQIVTWSVRDESSTTASPISTVPTRVIPSV
jgi:ribonucleoside-diphosphate reductase beta chain